MTDEATVTLPQWDTSTLYPDLADAAYLADARGLGDAIAALGAYLDEHGIRRLDDAPGGPVGPLAASLAGALERLEALDRRFDLVGSFVYAHVTTNSYDEVAQRELSKLEKLGTKLRPLGVRLQGWIGSLEPRLGELMDASALLREHRFFLEDAARKSRHLMPEALEALAAELLVDGASAFGKLQGNVTSQLKVPFARDGEEGDVPITVVRNLCSDPDPAVRERAYHAELAGWKTVRTSVAAALNAVKGTAVTLTRRRGYASVLDHALENNRIDGETLDALMGSIREAFPVFRRYLRSKARKLGRDVLPWWDIFAPMGAVDKRYDWRQARDFIVGQFSRFSPALGAYGARAFDERWIDAEPRDGKRGGAFCMGVAAREQSLILANFDGSFDQVSTLAHELGHGFHNACQEGLPILRRGAPSTLAETASIMCETLVAEAALTEADEAERLMILEAQLLGATQVCLDISSRFIFEREVLGRRADSELSADELCAIMRDAQAQTYGDAVDPATYHPYMWLWKPHYYSHGHNFYNFPYAFGHLFGLGLYAVYQDEGDAFVPRYTALLRSTGEDFAAPLAARFGIDLRSAAFWKKSLAVVEGMVERYEAL
jgi:pepF/M3 family oligoendopeptidase